LLTLGQKGRVGTDSHLICSLLPLQCGIRTNQTNKNPRNSKSSPCGKKPPTNPERSSVYGHTTLNVEAKQGKQGWAWLVLGQEKDLQRRLLRDKEFVGKVGMLTKFKWSKSFQTSQNNQV
jgi:hypothetical protein